MNSELQRESQKKWIRFLAPALLLAAAGFAYMAYQPDSLPDSIARGNGRLEAQEIDVATKLPGRVEEVLVEEGEMVKAGQVLARINVDDLQAELRQAQATLRQVQESAKYAEAVVDQYESELSFAEKELTRSTQLSQKGHVSAEKLDLDKTSKLRAEAALKAARIKVVEAQAAIEAAQAAIERLYANIAESELKAPIDARVLYRLAEPGEVLGSGGKVVALLDLTDVYMTIFLPTYQAGVLSVGADARVVVDALPDLRIPARVSYVAPRAQFTPKQVETQTEREKLMFRVKVKIDPDLLKAHQEKVKTGVTGVAFVKLEDAAEWPEDLQVRLQ
ncbi:efflux RND transporter periplasmic adaptor subunit [Hahella sp. CR1]|uniref:HlyD family secretion protein n=1 Tax=Hahella sp. CR1 TaxID=2992807 RepID=UPI00244368C2|nr:HlyD family efflux transporter periplasmic adaptor subunit [Hahella sp. CR1]MDG9671699.1 efflux RND transporter periplasmic adaptor subunit [Hahella sp. CR1]